MKLDSEARVNILAVGTALVVAFVRHSIGRTAWEGVSQLLIWWFIHTIALFLLILGASFAIDRWHRIFLGEDGNLLPNRVKFQYYITMTTARCGESIAEIAKRLCRSERGIRHRAQTLGIKLPSRQQFGSPRRLVELGLKAKGK